MELKVYHNLNLSSRTTKVVAVFDKYNKKNLVPLKFFPDHDNSIRLIILSNIMNFEFWSLFTCLVGNAVEM